MDPIREILKSDNPMADYKTVNACVRAVNDMAKEIARLRYQLETISAATTDAGVVFFPFKIYQLPSTLRNQRDPDSDWLKVRVRAGRVGSQVVDGTDICDDNPDSGRYPLIDDNGDPIKDIVIPAGKFAYWFWIEIDGGLPTVKHSDRPANDGWATFPDPDPGHVPIGFVDTETLRQTHQIIIRQILRNDIIGVPIDVCVTDETGENTKDTMYIPGFRAPGSAAGGGEGLEV
jgi:hypothetical protein